MPSPPGEERAVADRVTAYLRELGLEVEEDDAGATIGSNAGNLLCRLPGRANGGTPLFLCAHLDTVPPQGPLEPVVEDGDRPERRRDDPRRRQQGGRRGDARGGATDRRGAAAARRARAPLHAEGGGRPPRRGRLRPHEARGRARLRLRPGGARSARSSSARPYGRTISARFHGRAAHAGMVPEEGRSAIAAASRAIADLRLGRIDEQTTANVGLITGGTRAQHRPRVVQLRGRGALARRAGARRPRPGDARHDRLRREPRRLHARDDDRRHLRRLSPPARTIPSCELAAGALERCGFEVTTALTGGGADANVFNERGIPCLNLANGMAEIHTADEHIAVADLDAMVDVTLALVDLASSMPLGLRRGIVTAVLESRERLVRLEVDGIAVPRLPAPDRRGRGRRRRARERAGATARARLGRLRRPLREPDARARARSRRRART